MSWNAFQESGESHIEAAKLCRENGLIMPALVITYVTIDIMATLNRPAGKTKVTRQDFIDWVDTYIIPHLNSNCNAIDLYSARCGVVHSSIAESDFTKGGSAKKLIYSWGNKPSTDLQDLVDQSKKSDITVVDFDDLLDSLKKGFTEFSASAFSDKELNNRVSSRADLLFGHRDPNQEILRL